MSRRTPSVVRFSLAAMVALAAVLGGCAYVPLSSLYRLKSFDLGAFDPAALRVAIRINEAVARRPGAVVKVETVFNGDEASRRVQEIAMESVTEAGELAPLSSFAQGGEAVYLYRIAPRDVARVRALQEEGRARAKSGAKASVEIKPEPKGCLARPLPPGPLHADLVMRIAPQEPYFVVLKRVELRSELANRGVDLADHLPPC